MDGPSTDSSPVRTLIIPFVVVLVAAAFAGKILGELERYCSRTDRASFHPDPGIERLNGLFRSHRTVVMVSDSPRPDYRCQLVQRVITPVAVQKVLPDLEIIARRVREGEPLILDMGDPARRGSILEMLAARQIRVSVSTIDSRLVVVEALKP